MNTPTTMEFVLVAGTQKSNGETNEFDRKLPLYIQRGKISADIINLDEEQLVSMVRKQFSEMRADMLRGAQA